MPEAALRATGASAADLAESIELFAPAGSEVCQGTGYKGQVRIYQVMPISEEMSRISMRQGNAHDIANQARRKCIRTLRQSGL